MPVFKKTQTTYPVFYLIVCTALQVVLAALFSKTRAQVPEPHVPIAMQWHFDGDRRVSTEGGVDWVFSILPNDKNQYLVSGYTSTDRIIRPGYSYYLNTVPSLFKLDNLGRILWSKEITSVSSHGMTYDGQSYGGLYQIIKTSSGYAAIGFVTTTTAGDASLLVEYDDAGTIINQALLQPTYMGGATPCHTYSIALDPSGNNYIIAGDAGAGTYWNAFVAKVSRSTMSITASYFAGNSSGDNLFEKVLVQATGGGNYNIYASGYKSMSGDNTNVSGTNNSGNTVTLTKHNKDIWLLSLSSNFSTVLHNATYNKTTLNYPSSLYYTEAGLLTARTMATANLSPVMTANLRADAGHDVNNDERGYDMILSQDGKIIILALINGIYVRGPYGGTNGHYIFRNDPSNGGVKGVVDPNRPSGSNYYDDYMDGDGYILKIDPSSSYNVSYTKNVGHFGSKDCHPRIIQEANGRLVIGGSTTDYGMGVNYYDAYMLATGDNSTAGHYWRRACHAHSEDAMCFFALAATADGGIIIGGDRTVNQNTEDDNFSVTKFAPECASTFGKSNYHLFGQQLDIATNTTWSAGTRYIASKIVIRPGAKLTINNSTIKFAASDHMWDYCDFGLRNSDGRQIGIVVDPGGELEINNSTLKGMDACGRMMWDGIVIQGNTGTSAKGILRLNNSTIADARIGVMVAEAYRATLTQHAPTSSTFSPNIDAYTYSTRYNSYGWFGGGTVFASGSTFKNCRFSVNYQNNPTPGTTSGYFGGNTFICDSNMADPCMYIYPDGSPMPSDNFFAAWNVNKVNFEDNTFTIDTKYPFDHRPMGILLSDAGARIQASCSALDAAGNCIGTLGSGNSFSNLKYGVNAIYTPAKSGLQLVISQNTFNNNGRGTAIFNSSSPSVNRNTFKVPGNTGSFPYPMGVQIEGARSYAVEGNTFTKCTGCGVAPQNSTGVVVNNHHGYDEIVRKNTFTDLQFGCISQLNNSGTTTAGLPTGLQWRCNDYSSNTKWGILRTSYADGPNATVVFQNATIRQHQGEVTPDPRSTAGNRFYNSCFSGDNFLAADAATGQNVDYYHPGFGSLYDPGPCRHFRYIPINTSQSTAYNNVCPETIGGTGSAGIVAMRGNLYNIELKLTAPGLSEMERAYYTTQKYLQVSEMARYYVSVDLQDSAAFLMKAYGRYAEAIEHFMAAGMWPQVSENIALLPTASPQEQNYKWLCRKALDVYSTGDTWYDMDSLSKDSVDQRIAYDNIPGKSAYAIHCMVNDEALSYLDPSMPTWGGSGSFTGRFIGDEIPKDNPGFTFSVFPNPSSGNFTVNSSHPGKFKIYTPDAREMASFDVVPGSTRFALPLHLSPGVYVGKMVNEQNRATVVRLIYQP